MLVVAVRGSRFFNMGDIMVEIMMSLSLFDCRDNNISIFFIQLGLRAAPETAASRASMFLTSSGVVDRHMLRFMLNMALPDKMNKEAQDRKIVDRAIMNIYMEEPY
ncbi:hypothetical protein ACJX0J_038714, partial [Zea mays]